MVDHQEDLSNSQQRAGATSFTRQVLSKSRYSSAVEPLLPTRGVFFGCKISEELAQFLQVLNCEKYRGGTITIEPGLGGNPPKVTRDTAGSEKANPINFKYTLMQRATSYALACILVSENSNLADYDKIGVKKAVYAHLNRLLERLDRLPEGMLRSDDLRQAKRDYKFYLRCLPALLPSQYRGDEINSTLYEAERYVSFEFPRPIIETCATTEVGTTKFKHVSRSTPVHTITEAQKEEWRGIEERVELVSPYPHVAVANLPPEAVLKRVTPQKAWAESLPQWLSRHISEKVRVADETKDWSALTQTKCAVEATTPGLADFLRHGAELHEEVVVASGMQWSLVSKEKTFSFRVPTSIDHPQREIRLDHGRQNVEQFFNSIGFTTTHEELRPVQVPQPGVDIVGPQVGGLESFPPASFPAGVPAGVPPASAPVPMAASPAPLPRCSAVYSGQTPCGEDLKPPMNSVGSKPVADVYTDSVLGHWGLDNQELKRTSFYSEERQQWERAELVIPVDLSTFHTPASYDAGYDDRVNVTGKSNNTRMFRDGQVLVGEYGAPVEHTGHKMSIGARQFGNVNVSARVFSPNFPVNGRRGNVRQDAKDYSHQQSFDFIQCVLHDLGLICSLKQGMKPLAHNVVVTADPPEERRQDDEEINADAADLRVIATVTLAADDPYDEDNYYGAANEVVGDHGDDGQAVYLQDQGIGKILNVLAEVNDVCNISEEKMAEIFKRICDSIDDMQSEDRSRYFTSSQKNDYLMILVGVYHYLKLLNDHDRGNKRNKQLFLASLHQLLAKKIGGVSSGNSKTTKDTMGLVSMHEKAMEMYYRSVIRDQYDLEPDGPGYNDRIRAFVEGSLPSYRDSRKARNRFVDCVAFFYETGHDAEVASQNNLGSFGIKDVNSELVPMLTGSLTKTRMLPADIEKKVGEKLVRNYVQASNLNKVKPRRIAIEFWIMLVIGLGIAVACPFLLPIIGPAAVFILACVGIGAGIGTLIAHITDKSLLKGMLIGALIGLAIGCVGVFGALGLVKLSTLVALSKFAIVAKIAHVVSVVREAITVGINLMLTLFNGALNFLPAVIIGLTVTAISRKDLGNFYRHYQDREYLSGAIKDGIYSAHVDELLKKYPPPEASASRTNTLSLLQEFGQFAQQFERSDEGIKKLLERAQPFVEAMDEHQPRMRRVDDEVRQGLRENNGDFVGQQRFMAAFPPGLSKFYVEVGATAYGAIRGLFGLGNENWRVYREKCAALESNPAYPRKPAQREAPVAAPEPPRDHVEIPEESLSTDYSSSGI